MKTKMAFLKGKSIALEGGKDGQGRLSVLNVQSAPKGEYIVTVRTNVWVRRMHVLSTLRTYLKKYYNVTNELVPHYRNHHPNKGLLSFVMAGQIVCFRIRHK